MLSTCRFDSLDEFSNPRQLTLGNNYRQMILMQGLRENSVKILPKFDTI